MDHRIAILGSTGSIGCNALRVIDSLGADYRVYALTAHHNVELLAEQVRRYSPKVIGLTNPDRADAFREIAGSIDAEILVGPDSLAQIASDANIDTVLAAVVGAAGLGAVLAAAENGKRIAIANKEPLVIAGELLMKTAANTGAQILPVDSEHSAIFQSLQSGTIDEVHKIILTASGGPFRGATKKEVESVTVEQALAHPTWDMGPKITIDSATLMNKALEVIEARWLFGVEAEKIDVLIHPESIIHSMVEFIDGSVIAQMGLPDMCVPIQYALTYPFRQKGIASRMDLGRIGSLTFEKPDLEVFRTLALGFEVARIGGTSAAVFNAANEAAVEHFLAGRIAFCRISELIEDCLNNHEVKAEKTLGDLLEVDAWARNHVRQSVKVST